ncbi:MAG: TlyA family rRNA (cytidine-2'-O)-methyltransferase [Tenericutes bacterium HGW-Tenericutes-3]|nr:MAG: TlyA family rRNA (cytidine-2'-O)-methyltransferase [Tenericutes bacterium HGW-Tenericutes-3]
MRLDHYLVNNQMVRSRSQATDLIKRGLVLVDDKIITKTGYDVQSENIKLIQEPMFASRGGEKLLQAVIDFDIIFHGKTVIDIGSSTGGFTDCALQYGAKEVYAYDVGTNQMIEPLKSDQRVHLFEETNILDVELPTADMILIDVSFTSILPILNHLKGFKGEIVALIKPQFEAGHTFFKQGVLKDIKMHKKIVEDILDKTKSFGFSIHDLKKSGLKGKAGNQEYVLYIKDTLKEIDIKKMIKDNVC